MSDKEIEASTSGALQTQTTQDQRAPRQLEVVSVEALKAKQKSTRRQLTLNCQRLKDMVLKRDSRRGVRAVADRVNDLMKVAETMDEQLMALLSEEDEERQVEGHLSYVQLHASTMETAEIYLAERAGDAESVVSSLEGQMAHAELASARSHLSIRQSTLEQRRQLAIAQQAVLEAEQQAEEARSRANEARVHMEEVAASIRSLDLDPALRVPSVRAPSLTGNGPRDTFDNPMTLRWLTQQREWSRQPCEAVPDLILSEEGPDAWIDRYITGRENPVVHSSSHHSSVKIELPSFSCRALDWFGWVDLFHALVHITPKSAGERLAILKEKLRGTPAEDLVYGLGGGEMAYKEALNRLKHKYGRRDVMRAAHMQALERMEFPKGDPAAFLRAAERTRTHLFDLGRIGEQTGVDIIERVCQKLTLSDRLAWNEGRCEGLETRSLSQFGTWLVARATAYQNAYSIAAFQHSSGARTNNFHGKNETKGKPHHQARTHQSANFPSDKDRQ